MSVNVCWVCMSWLGVIGDIVRLGVYVVLVLGLYNIGGGCMYI